MKDNKSGGDGSSPRARGTPLTLPPPTPGRRFIPASAGNTRLFYPAGEPEAVHPRERGEHFSAFR